MKIAYDESVENRKFRALRDQAGYGPSGNYIGTPGDIWLGGGAGQSTESLRAQSAANMREREAQEREEDARNAAALQRLEVARKENETKSLMKLAYDSKVPEEITADDASGFHALSFKAKQAGDFLMQQGLIKEAEIAYGKASKFGKDAADANKALIEHDAYKEEEAGELLSEITSQEDLNTALPQLAKLGVVIPDRYRVFSDGTQKFLSHKSMISKKVMASKQLELDMQKAAEVERKNKEEAEIKRDKEFQKREKESRSRDAYKAGVLTKTKPSEKEINNELVIMGQEDIFSELTSEDQLAAAEAIRYVASGLVVNRKAESMDIALALARDVVKGRIGKDGKYNPLTDVSTSSEYVETRTTKDGRKLGRKADGTIEEIK